MLLYFENFTYSITFVFLDAYVKTKGKRCSVKNHTMYQTLIEAKVACTLQRNDCWGIYDDSCDGNDYYICEKNSKILSSQVKNTCIYTQPFLGNQVFRDYPII